MSIKIVLAPYKDPANGLDWPEQKPMITQDLKKYISSYPAGTVEYRAEETDHGIGADWPTITIEVIEIAGIIFFAIPAVHKKICETIAEWRKVKTTIDNFLTWLSRKEPIVSYSIEKAFLDSLEYLESSTNILELELVQAIEIPGKSSSSKSNFDTSLLLYFVFIFRERDERLFIVTINSKLDLILIKELPLDPRNR